MGLNPCCIAMYPAAAATCRAGSCSTTNTSTKPVVESAALFVLGNAVAITVLGVGAAVAGSTLGGLGEWVAYLVAAVPILMGLHLLGWLRLPMPKSLSAYGLGNGLPLLVIGTAAGGLTKRRERLVDSLGRARGGGSDARPRILAPLDSQIASSSPG